MSTLGKILTVLIALVSIAVAVLMATEVAQRGNWKALYEEQVKQFNTALDQRDSAFQQRDTLRSQTDAERAGLQQQIDTLTDELALRNNTITDLRGQFENQEKRLQELATALTDLKTNYEALVATRDEYRRDRDDAKKEADTLRGMYAELEGKQRVALAQVSDLKETLRQAEEQIASLQGKIAWMSEQTGVAPPEEVPLLPTAKLGGYVTEVDNTTRVAQIDLGSDDGVVKGMKFYVYDEADGKSQYLATLTVDEVSHDSAAGQLSVIRGTVQKGHHVTNRFIE